MVNMMNEAIPPAVVRLAGLLKPIGEGGPGADSECLRDLQESYRQFLSISTGGYTTDDFYHFFGLTGGHGHNVLSWNDVGCWKRYFGLDQTFFVFAENIFGDQFGFDLTRRRKVVKILSSTTGDVANVPFSFESFVQSMVLEGRDAKLAATVQEYFAMSGEVYRPFHHLSHNIPPCLGGVLFDIRNLSLIDSLTNLTFTGQLLTQVKQLKPGTRIAKVEIDRTTHTVRLITDEV
jgi:hypothetical protein